MPAFFDEIFKALSLGNNPSNPSAGDNHEADSATASTPSLQNNNIDPYREEYREERRRYLAILSASLEELGPDEYYCFGIQGLRYNKQGYVETKEVIKDRVYDISINNLRNPFMLEKQTLFKDKSSVIEFIDIWSNCPIGSKVFQHMGDAFANYECGTYLVKFHMPLKAVTLTPAKIMFDCGGCDIDEFRDKYQYRGHAYSLDSGTLKRYQSNALNENGTINMTFFNRFPSSCAPPITILSITEIPSRERSPNLGLLNFDYRSTSPELNADKKPAEEPGSELIPPPVSRFQK